MPTFHPYDIAPDSSPDLESRRIRQHRAWYAETAARRAEWEEREREAEKDPPSTLGEKIGLAFLIVCSLLILGGGLRWVWLAGLKQHLGL